MIKKQFGTYHNAIEKAWEDLNQLDLESIKERCLCTVNAEQGEIHLKFINQTYCISPAKLFAQSETGEEPPGPVLLLLLHYLISAKAVPLTGQLLPYRKLPAGDVFSKPFKVRSIEPLARVFANDEKLFIEAGKALGGKQVPYGDAAVELPVFPRTPITCVLWTQCEEFPAAANILFDETATEHFHIEDLAVLGEITAGTLILQSGASDPGIGVLYDRETSQ